MTICFSYKSSLANVIILEAKYPRLDQDMNLALYLEIFSKYNFFFCGSQLPRETRRIKRDFCN